MTEATPPFPNPLQRTVGLVLGLAVFTVMLLWPAPEGLSPAGWRTAAVGLLMASWWMTEALPIPATALLPLVLFPLLGILPIREAAAPFANPLIFLYMGGFMLALAMQRWGLHRRIALSVIRGIGTGPRRIILGFMLAAAFLSMWVSNTATTMMMLPIGLSVVELARTDEHGGANFGVVLMLALAYAASIGGIATPIGTPTNVVLAGFLEESYGFELGFARWMLLGLPLAVIGLALAYAVLTRFTFPIHLREIPGGRAYILDELRRMGPMNVGEKSVAVVFGLTAVLWVTRPLLQGAVPGLSDTGIAIAGALVLFVLPVDRKGTFVMNWTWAEKLPWGVLVLFGGGLSLAAAVSATGLAVWIGEALSGVADWPVLLILVLVVTVIVFLTELTSNVATATAFLPVLAALALAIGQNPLLLAIPATIAASCAFMLPVATPPNAIVFGSGMVSISQMARAGFWLNVLFIGLVTLLAYTLLPVVFDVGFGRVPTWVMP